MADSYTDPFGTPDIAINPTPSPEDHATLKSQWDNFLADPRGRGALLSFGLQLMQPVSAGQSPLGQIGQGIGRAGEGVQQYDKSELAQNEASSKQDLRSAQAGTAEARATAATANSNTAALRAENAGREVDSKINLRNTQAQAAQSRAALLDNKVRQLDQLIAVFPDDQELKRQHTEAKIGLVQAQTELANTRVDTTEQDANTREARAGTAQQRVDQQGDIGNRNATVNERRATVAEQRSARQNVPSDTEGSKNERNRMNNLLRAQAQHQRAVADITKRNKDPLRDSKAPAEAIPTFQDWVSQNPALKEALGGKAPTMAPAANSPTTPPPDYSRYPATPPAMSFTGRTATGPNGEKLRETTEGKWVP